MHACSPRLYIGIVATYVYPHLTILSTHFLTFDTVAHNHPLNKLKLYGIQRKNYMVCTWSMHRTKMHYSSFGWFHNHSQNQHKQPQ